MPSMQRIYAILIAHYRWILPCLLVALVAPWFTAIDLSITRYYFAWGKSHGQRFYNTPLVNFLYAYGPWPGLALFYVASLVAAASFFVSFFKHYRQAALCLTLSMILGSGIFIHAIFKDHWGRPRPKQVIEFGGSEPFRPFYKPNFSSNSGPTRSFPCGHCSTSFYFFSLALVLKRAHKQRAAVFTFVITLAWGALISWVRIAQGGHFFSDAVVSALIMWLSALFCDWVFYTREIGARK